MARRVWHKFSPKIKDLGNKLLLQRVSLSLPLCLSVFSLWQRVLLATRSAVRPVIIRENHRRLCRYVCVIKAAAAAAAAAGRSRRFQWTGKRTKK